MSTFIITIEDNGQGVAVKANDIRSPGDQQTVAHAMGCFLIDTLNQYLAAHGVNSIVPVSSQQTTH